MLDLLIIKKIIFTYNFIHLQFDILLALKHVLSSQGHTTKEF